MTALMAAAVFAAAAVWQQDVPAVTADGAFGFANAAGTEIIVVHEMAQAADMQTAICDGRSRPIRFVRRQTEGGAHRESSIEFEHLAGTVFQVIGQPVHPEETCFVASSAFLADAQLLRVVPRSTRRECSRTERQRVAALRQRRLKACWTIAAIEPHGLVAAVEYVRDGRHMLASLALQTDDRAILIDFPAEYRGPGQEAWRAGDDGEFSPGGLNVPFLIRRVHAYYVAVDWRGEEGNSLSLYESQPKAPVRKLTSDYWYRAPR